MFTHPARCLLTKKGAREQKTPSGKPRGRENADAAPTAGSPQSATRRAARPCSLSGDSAPNRTLPAPGGNPVVGRFRVDVNARGPVLFPGSFCVDHVVSAVCPGQGTSSFGVAYANTRKCMQINANKGRRVSSTKGNVHKAVPVGGAPRVLAKPRLLVFPRHRGAGGEAVARSQVRRRSPNTPPPFPGAAQLSPDGDGRW